MTSTAIAAASIVLWTGEAAAEGLYLGVHGGVAFLQDAEVADGAVEADIIYNPGIAVGAEVGYSFHNGLRLGGEVTFRSNSQESIEADDEASDIEGDAQSFALMANAYYDIATGTAITPYVGAGLGGAIIDFSIDEIEGNAAGFSDSDIVFAYQAMAGASYAITDQVSAGLEYRFFATTEASFSDAGDNLDAEYFSHNVLLTLRYSFD